MSTSHWADRVVVPCEIAVSSRGDLCHVRSSADVAADRHCHSLWLGPGAGRRLTDGPDDRLPAWSPDGSAIAFVRTPDAGPPLLALLEIASGTVRELALGYRPAGPIRWAPDGGRLAFVGAPDDVARAEAPVVVTESGYRADGRGLLRGGPDRLVLVDLAVAWPIELTVAGLRITSCAWSPRGDEIAFTAVDEPTVGLGGASRAYLTSATPGCASPETLSPADGEARAVVWTAAGPAWVGKTRSGPGHDTLLRRGSTVEEPVDLLASLDRNVVTGGPGYPGGRPVALPDGRGVVVCLREAGGTRLVEVPVDGPSAPRDLGGGEDAYVMGFDVDQTTGGVVACVARSDSAGELELWPADRPAVRITSLTADAGPVPGAVAPERRHFSISDGVEVAAWLLRPATTGPAPLLVDLHGGPHNAWSAALSPALGYHRELLERGWAILLPDPRGSDGYGERHLLANLGSWGSGDTPDILEPVASLVEEGTADPARVALHGYSYGGYLTCWLTTQSDLFVAAIAGGCIADTTSMTASDSLRELVDDLGAAPWTDPARVDAQSPYRRVDRVHTPTLLLHGLADDTCPPHQAEQWFAALRARGVPTEMVLYPGASHVFAHTGRPSHRRDYSARVVDWLERYADGEVSR